MRVKRQNIGFLVAAAFGVAASMSSGFCYAGEVTLANEEVPASVALTEVASPSVSQLNPPSGTLAFTYDPATGDVKVNYNGFTGFAGKQTFNTTTRALSLIDIQVSNGAFTLDDTKLTPASLTALSGLTVSPDHKEINMTAVNGYLPDGTDIGPILPKNLDPAVLANALTLTFNYSGSRVLAGGTAGLIAAPIPEPTTLSLLGLGALGLLARRRKIQA